MRDRLAALQLFVRVARTGSFSRAGRELGYSQPSASRVIAELEREVGAALLARTTRTVTLTEAGADYLTRIEPILDALEEANQGLRGGGELRGQLRVGLPASIAIRELIPRLPPFMARHPSLRLELLLEDRRQDLVRDGIDVAIRLGELSDSTATARVIGVNQRVLAASPAYLERAGRPARPAALVDHALIVGPPGAQSGAWTFERHGERETVRAKGQLSVNVNEAATAAAVAGLGIVSTGVWGCRAELAAGTLVRVLPEWRLGAVEVHAVFPTGRAAKPSARAFVDHLLQTLAND